MGLPPVVTGVSPKEGPPGTRVTIRGENFGYGPEDIIGLIICGSDCLLSAEWKSSNKIVARSGPGKGRGDITVITKSGGTGSCTVQFRGYHETTGPLKESAVWVDESHLLALGRHRTLIPSSYQQDDPLGISVESTDNKFPEEELHDLFPDGNGDLGSENFTPAWFLLERHHTTSFDDLRAGLSFLKRKVEGQKDGQISFLKAHAGSVIEQMDTLNTLKAKVEDNKKIYGPDLTRSLEKSILMAKEEADRLFQDVLERKDQADRTRNALGILQRFRFLFHLPASLDRNIQKADYDLVINDYARAKALFGNTDVQVFKRVLQEADQRIVSLRQLLHEKLLKFPSTIDEQKKIIRNLVHLESPDDPAWNCTIGQYKYCSKVLFQCKDEFLAKEPEETEKIGSASKSKKQGNMLTPAAALETNDQNQTPNRILFVEELTDIFSAVFPELWKLGQAYFLGELYVRVDSSKQEEFKKMILDVVMIYSQLVRAAFIPNTLDRTSPHRAQYGLWPAFQSSFSDHEGIGSWHVSCLQIVRNCYATLLSLVDLPNEPLNAIRDFLHDLRVHCMRSLLMQATENVSLMVLREEWQIEYVEQHGSITRAPHAFETQVVECLQLVKETVLQAEQREPNLMENPAVLSDLNLFFQKLLLNFPRALERLVASDHENSDHLSREVKLLLGLSNCQYTRQSILPRLRDQWHKLGYPDLSSALNIAMDQLEKTDKKLMEDYLEEKVEPLIGIVEQSMYAGKFDWNKALDQPEDVRPYCKEIIMNMIGVHAEVAQICPSLVNCILERVAQDVGQELRRLFTCVQHFSRTGALQARADLAAISRACRGVTRRTRDPFTEAERKIPSLEPGDDQNLKKIVANFERRMKFQLLCLDI